MAHVPAPGGSDVRDAGKLTRAYAFIAFIAFMAFMAFIALAAFIAFAIAIRVFWRAAGHWVKER